MNTQALFQHAKDIFLEQGEQHGPILFVDYTDTSGEAQHGMFFFADWGRETALAEKQDLFRLGAQFGEENGTCEIESAAFISEAWIATVAPGEKKTWKRPRDAPNRREALVMQLIEIQPSPSGKGQMKQSFRRVEIIRHGETVDLGPEQTDAEYEISNLLLPGYFLAGYSASQCSSEDLLKIWKKYVP